MPLVDISIRKGRSKSEKKSLMDVVHSALVQAFKIPDGGRIQRLFEFDEDEFEIAEGKTNYFTLIKITILPGRSLEAKRNLYQFINNGLKAIGYKNPNDSITVLYEPPLDNWGVQGGLSASDVDIDFKLNV